MSTQVEDTRGDLHKDLSSPAYLHSPLDKTKPRSAKSAMRFIYWPVWPKASRVTKD